MGLLDGAKYTCDCCGAQVSKSDAMNLLYVNIQYAEVQDDAVLCGDCVNRLKELYAVAHTKEESKRAAVTDAILMDRIDKYLSHRLEYVDLQNNIKNEKLKSIIGDLINEADTAVSNQQEYLSGDDPIEKGVEYRKSNDFFGEPVFSIDGDRGRHIDVYEDFAVITVSVTVGSVLSGNAMDGEKVLFYKDCIGIQFKEPGLTLGFLQLETASASTNNLKSNYFNENTFTFYNDVQTVKKAYRYIFERVKETKIK